MKSNNIKSFNEYQYDELDCAELPMFSGGFVNFGFWKNINYIDNINKKIRKQSSIDLYKEAAKYLNIQPSDILMEVGCGRGNGIPIIWSKYKPSKIIGIDASEAQINRAQSINSLLVNKRVLSFYECFAENIEVENETIDKVISIEALQNFYSVEKFASELNRILKRDGKALIATVFATSNQTAEQINNLKEKNMKRNDNLISVSKIYESFSEKFDITSISIGKNVFKGYYNLLSQLNLIDKSLWSSNFYPAYLQGWIDYYFILLEKRGD